MVKFDNDCRGNFIITDKMYKKGILQTTKKVVKKHAQWWFDEESPEKCFSFHYLGKVTLIINYSMQNIHGSLI